jgi:flagellar biosynthesis protein FlhB
VAEEDVSEDESENGDNADDEKNKAKTEQYQKIKDRLKKGKFSKSTEVKGGRKLATIFKLVSAVVQILDEVK